MFSGIIEEVGKVERVTSSGSNRTFIIRAPMAPDLQPDQSVAHNGVCLTVEKVQGETFEVTAVEETLRKSNLSDLRTGSLVNLERSVTLQTRLDGHLVQGHVDTTASCIQKEEQDGSWLFSFQYQPHQQMMLVEKGSITVNGISLTAFDCLEGRFSVAVIPYTFQHTNLQFLNIHDRVNLEFDLIGKYVAQWMARTAVS